MKTKTPRRVVSWLLGCAAALAFDASAATVTTLSPQGEVALVRQVRATFSDSMVRFGDPRLPAPLDLHCTPTGTARWVDDKTWVFDFNDDLPAGTACTLTLKSGLKTLAGDAVTGPASYAFSTGGPAIVRAYPFARSDGGTAIEEEQVFALLLDGTATTDSIQRFGHCQAAGIGEQLPLQVIGGAVRDDILKAIGLVAQQARVAVVRCARPLPPGAKMALVWGAGIATPSGVANSKERRIAYQVRTPFAASMTCERENSRADCLPIRPLRLEFSAPVPRSVAEHIALVTADGRRLAPQVETGRGDTSEQLLSVWDRGVRGFLWLLRREPGRVGDARAAAPDEGVSAVVWNGPLPDRSALRIELPPALKDDAGRVLSNAGQFPLAVRTADAPALAKFAAAPFGVLELNAEPMLPVTLRHVEPDLGAPVAAQGSVRDLTLHDDAQIIDWLARVRRYQETRLKRDSVEAELHVKLPPPPAAPSSSAPGRSARRYGADASASDGSDDDEDDDTDDADALAARRQAAAQAERRTVQSRTVSLLDNQPAARRLSLPPADTKDTRPFEVVGIPLPEPGLHIVEIASRQLGRALLDRDASVYVRTAALVTNLGVHFKWGALNSAAWVTTLDTGQPVPDAQVAVSDCLGKQVWSGRSDAHGVAAVPMALRPLDFGDCRPRGMSGDEDGHEIGYFVSARHADAAGRADMAFVWTTWNQGLETWRFHVDGDASRYRNDGTDGDHLLHTVFDRTLLRAGQTVSMKHVARTEHLVGQTLTPPDALPTSLHIEHLGSGQSFDQPITWRNGRAAESSFAIPADARLGLYTVSLGWPKRQRSVQTGQFRVEEFRLPVMTGRIVPPQGALVQPASVPMSFQVNYGNGGGAAGLALRVSAQLRPAAAAQASLAQRYPGFSFEPPRKASNPDRRSVFAEAYVDEDDEADAVHAKDDDDTRLVADKLAVTLDANGAGRLALGKLPPLQSAAELLVQGTYADPDGEVQTLSQTLPVWPSAIVLGVKTDRWVSVRQQLPTQVLALDTAGKPMARAEVSLRAVLHKVSSTRRRLVGGFYAYDNRSADVDLGPVCSGLTDARGLLLCDVKLKEAGDIELIAESQDAGGHVARASAGAWVTRQGELWFGGDNDDRMDVIPEQRSYEPGQLARFQVRMPFRSATALVAIERNGIIETRTVALNGKDPTIELPVKAEWGPNVYVSVLAVRGRIREVPWYSFFDWGWRQPSDWWSAWRGDGQLYQAPTAMVDLSRPAFKYGIAEIEVGIAAHRLKVAVSTDKPSYPIRAIAQVRVKVALPDGQPAPAGTEVALAAVDEALLELMPNESWDILRSMIRHRGYEVETSTAQMQIIGKRHFGKKAAPAGGGGGQFPTRELFDTLLLWNPHVVLDAQGMATVPLPLNDALTGFRIVAVADAVVGNDAALYGSGSASIHSTQDLQIVSGLPPLVREGDRYQAGLTLRNTTSQPMDVTLTAQVFGTDVGTSTDTHIGPPVGTTIGVIAGTSARSNAGLPLATQKVHVPANAAQPVSWDVLVPFNAKSLDWTVSADAGSAKDRLSFTQKVAEAVPVSVQQATLMQLDKPQSLPIGAPVNALRDEHGDLRGGIAVGLKPRLADGLPGVRDYLLRYPWNCLEQRASIAIGLHDTAAWQRMAAQLPLYLDDDGLANYFPPAAGSRHTGSDSLTAYLLSVSAEAGSDYAIPDAARGKMTSGLVAFVEGRIERRFWVPAFLHNGDLDVRKLAALEALSRSGQAQPRMLQSIQVLPNQWPTGAVIDWLMVLDRVQGIPDRDQRIADATQVLRARLNMQGTRLGFSTERDDNWWWLMANGDVNAVRMALAVMARPDWHDDMGRLMIGALQRQQFGHWSTTVANAWGTLAVDAFSRTFEREAVGGTTRAGFDGGAAQTLSWAAHPQGGELSLGWPAAGSMSTAQASSSSASAFARTASSAVAPSAASTGPSTGSLRVAHDGPGRPWFTLVARAAVPLTQPLSSGYRITKTVTPVEQKTPGVWSRGDVLRISLKIDAQADMTWVVVSDPIPGGATLLGSGLGRDAAIEIGGERTDDRGWLAYQERSFEAFRAYYRYLPKGGLLLDYTVRLNNAGDFGLPPTRVEAMYAPEAFGELPNARLVVTP